MDQIRQDFRFALRSLQRAPAFSLIIVLTLGLGVGANTAIFSLMDQVLLRMLPVNDPERLVLLDGPGAFSGRTNGPQVFSVPMFRGLEAASGGVLEGLFARYETSATMAIGKGSERISAELVSGNYFPMLGVPAVLGRTLGPDDDRAPGAHPVAVLSYGFWQRRFGGQTTVLNQDVRINGHPMTVVGVAARDFAGVEMSSAVDVFVPLMMKAEMTPTWNDLDSWRSRWVTVMGRLRPGVSEDQAAAALNVAYRQLLHEDFKTITRMPPGGTFRDRFLSKNLLVLPGAKGRSELRSQFSTPLIVLMGMVGLVLLIACANVANLLLARAASQQKEVAIRLALGAGRWRVVRTRLTESLLLACGGAVLGVLLAWWTTSLLIDTLPFDRAARTLSAEPDARVVLFAIAVSTLTALLFGLAPAFQATKPALTSALKEGAGSVAGGGGQARFRKGLVVVQVALSVLLLAGAGLFARSLYNLRSLNPGFVTENLLQFSVDPALNGYSRARAQSLFTQMQDQLALLPGTVSVSAAVVPAMIDAGWRSTINVQGYERKEGEDMNPSVNAVGPGHFATMGMPLVIGRDFRATDVRGAPEVAIINETMAKYFWGDENPIGKRFGWARTDGFPIEVIGVVRDSKFTTLRDEIQRFVYVPYMQEETLDQMTFYVRTRADAAGVPAAARQVVQRLDPNMPIFDMKTMEAQLDESLFLERLVAALSVLFGGLATVLAAVGLYGVMSYTVSRRTREIGIRMALGAERMAVLWMVLREVAVMAAAGIVLGLPVAIGLSRFVQSQLYGLSPTDPATLSVTAFVLTGVALLAGYLPARRATRVDPIRALRYE